jgi:predicted metalloprotease with PDZ domain
LDERKDYLRLFSTWVHEYVHTWNVKAYRPKGITPYNYLHENYSNLLWFAEGATSYYDMLLTYRAGVADQQEFLKELTEMVKSYQSRPGVKYKSVAEASFDWWRKHKGSHDHNGSVSIYNEGAMVTLALDYWLRKRTDNQKSIDGLHRRLFELYRIDPTTREGHRGYSEQDIVKILSELSGYDASKVWDRWVNQPSQIDVASLLEYFGLELSADGNSSQLDFGWKLSDDNEFPFVERVLRDGPAWLAGIAAGDRLLAINGQQFNRQYYDLAKNNKWQSTEFEILLLRNEKVHRIQLSAKPGETNQTVIKIAGASEAQKENYRLWTGQPFDEPVENSSEK